MSAGIDVRRLGAGVIQHDDLCTKAQQAKASGIALAVKVIDEIRFDSDVIGHARTGRYSRGADVRIRVALDIGHGNRTADAQPAAGYSHADDHIKTDALFRLDVDTIA